MQAQGLSTRLRGRATRRESTVRQLVRSVRINHQKAQTMLGNIHPHRLNRKISKINHQRLLRMRTQRSRLIQATRLRASHLILSRNTHLSQTGPQSIIISRRLICFRTVRTQRARTLKQRNRRRTLQCRRRRQTTTHRNTGIDKKVRSERVGEHDVASALLIHRPSHARHIREPTLQMTRLNITHHHRALIPRHLQRGSTQHPITAQSTRNIRAVGQRHRQTRAPQKINVLAQQVQAARCRPHAVRLIAVGGNKLLADTGNLRAVARESRPLGGSGHGHRDTSLAPRRAYGICAVPLYAECARNAQHSLEVSPLDYGRRATRLES